MKRHLSFALLSFSLAFSCGKNSFREYETQNPSEQAVKALEERNPSKAITILLAELGPDFKNAYSNMLGQSNSEIIAALNVIIEDKMNLGFSLTPQLVSILASAHAQKYGVDPFDLALALASSSSDENEANSNSSGDENAMTKLFPVLPEATEENQAGLNQSLSILNSIGSSRFSNADFFKQALLLTANAAMVTKSLDKNGDGKIDINDAASLTIENAEALLDFLEQAAVAALGSAQAEDSTIEGIESNAAKSAQSIDKIKEEICATEGSSDTEKIQNYLSNQKPENLPEEIPDNLGLISNVFNNESEMMIRRNFYLQATCPQT